MQSKYLPLEEILGGHYEIVEVLGDDPSSILYLVEDTHRLENLFVIKELFLDASSHRDNTNILYTSDTSLSIFEQSKKERIEETKKLQKKKKSKFQTYGYFEEKNTVYTIMEFKKNLDIKYYLNVSSPNNSHPKEEKEKNSYIFSKLLLISVIIFIALGLYTYKMIEDEKESIKKKATIQEVNNVPMYHPPLTQREENNKRTVIPESNNDKNSSLDNNKTTSIPEGAEYISPEEQLKKEESRLLEESNLSEEVNFNELDNDSQIIPQDEIDNYQDAVTIPLESVIPQTSSTPISSSSSLGTPIHNNPQQRQQEHPMLGTPIKNGSISPF